MVKISGSSVTVTALGLGAHGMVCGLPGLATVLHGCSQRPCLLPWLPMTHAQVVKKYSAEAAINAWPQQAVDATDFGLQYGLKDDLAPPELSTTLETQLRKKGLDLEVSGGQCQQVGESPLCRTSGQPSAALPARAQPGVCCQCHW